MRRRKWALLIVVVLAVAAAVSGSLVAIGLGGGGTTRPAGAGNVLRLEPVQAEVSCGAGPAAVYVFLDDLVPRPSPLQADASYGVSAFELPLQYDPAIVRIAAPSDVQLNPQLDQEDADRDGIVHSFLPLISIDDLAGWAMLGAVGFVPSSQGPEENLEEGLDPVVKGEPLLLMTIRFTPVGHGAADLRVEPWDLERPERQQPGLYDPTGQPYEPLVLKGASLTVRGGECPEPPPPPPTLTPRPTPYVPPTQTPVPTPAPVDGVLAPEGGRPDCQSDWYVYRDPDGHFSLCYPQDWAGISSPPAAYFGSTISLEAPTPATGSLSDYIQLTVYWAEFNSYEAGVRSERCSPVSHWQDVQEVTLSIAERSVTACVGYESIHAPDAPPLRATFAEIPIGPGKGYVVMFLTQSEDAGHLAIADLSSVMQSLLLE